MERAVILNEEQYELVKGKPFAKDCYFNPVKDAYGRWVISFEELIAIEDKQFNWLWNCAMEKYAAPYQPNDHSI